ncbi:MAG TPA: hypothetical protein VFK93_03615, partial [Candidatus Limnocylindria bacterium]|nr:hypothetical protein [Candidatus Limnocylindria bacterium]
MPTRERPAPLVLVATGGADAPFGSYAAVAATGRQLLAAELSRRLGALGAPVVALRPAPPSDEFRWGPWFTAAARAALTATAADRAVDALGYVGAGALALAGDDLLDDLLSPVGGEVVANNRFSADAFVIAGDLDAALAALDDCPTDNAAARHLEEAGFTARDLAARPLSRFDVDTPLDLALLRLATRLPRQRHPDATVHRFLEMARLPGGGALEVPHLAEIGEVMRTQRAELVVAGRIPSAVWAQLERETACRVRAIVEERGMRSARGGTPRSILAAMLRRSSPAELVEELAGLGDAVILDSRVLMAALAGTADGAAWPPDEERFASDFLDPAPVATPWLRELTEAARASQVPLLLGSHTLVS